MAEQRQTALAVYPEAVPPRKIPEGLKLLLMGAAGGIMIGLLLGVGLICC